MRAVVLSIGSELLRGDIVDSNAAFLARHLSEIAVDVRRVQEIGDTLDDLTAAFREGLADADVLVSTGGLGPTGDDLTRQAIAAALGEDLYTDEQLVRDIEARFAAMGRRMPASNNQQAFLIPSAQAIPNPRGTAPGWLVERDGRIVVAMPGPPSEMQPMWLEQVQPRLLTRAGGRTAMLSLMTFGLGESAVEERIASIIGSRPDVTVATYAKSAGVEVHITARAGMQNEADELLHATEGLVRERLGEAIFGSGNATLSTAVGELLAQAGLRLATMESATGGALANLITDTPGSSDYFLGGLVAYTREAKIAYGVPPDTLDRHGLISQETALAMAQAAREQFAADVGLGTTGVAGRDDVEGHPSGTVYVAVSMRDNEQVRQVRRPADRETIKRFAAQTALDLLRRQLIQLEVAGP